MLINKIYLLSTMFAFLPMWSYAQKITLGACTTRDGGAYKGEMQASHMAREQLSIRTATPTKDNMSRANVKDKASTRSLTEKNMKANGSRTSSTGSAPIIL